MYSFESYYAINQILWVYYFLVSNQLFLNFQNFFNLFQREIIIEWLLTTSKILWSLSSFDSVWQRSSLESSVFGSLSLWPLTWIIEIPFFFGSGECSGFGSSSQLTVFVSAIFVDELTVIIFWLDNFYKKYYRLKNYYRLKKLNFYKAIITFLFWNSPFFWTLRRF
jgi:hypothetical protein